MDDYKTFSDRKLIIQITQNNHLAFSEIEFRYLPLAFFFTVSRIHDINEAKDIVYKLFFDVWQQRHSLTEDQDICLILISWLKEKVLYYYKTHEIPDSFTEKMQAHIDCLTDTELKPVNIQDLIDREVEAMPEPKKSQFRKIMLLNINSN